MHRPAIHGIEGFLRLIEVDDLDEGSDEVKRYKSLSHGPAPKTLTFQHMEDALQSLLQTVQAGLSEATIGLLLTFTLIGDTVISLWLTTRADRFGRRRTLILGSLLMIFAAVFFADERQVLRRPAFAAGHRSAAGGLVVASLATDAVSRGWAAPR